jgi:CheY-like chemotaxis protein
MATDIALVLENLLGFYPFDGKVVISVGAGGGQLAGYGRAARKVIAVDSDAAALAALAERIRDLGIEERFVLVQQDVMTVTERGDVALFEFSLHEMPDPAAALAHAATLAPDVVILDHAPGSPWSYAADEAEKVAASWAAATARGLRAERNYDAVQKFASYDELLEKLKGQGSEAMRRIERWSGSTAITIPITYRVARL